VLGAGFLGVGLFEEFFQRGYMLQTLMDGIRLPAAAVISCVTFMLLHFGNPGREPPGPDRRALAGILLLVLVLRTRSLWMAVGLHAAWDWAQSYLYGVPDSGQMVPGYLLRTEIHGPAWLSGGQAGPEGSVVALIVDLLLIIYVCKARWIVPEPRAAALWTREVEHKAETRTEYKPHSSDKRGKEHPMRIGIFTSVFGRPTLAERLDALRAHGLDCVQFD